jgi:DNA-3-methyladenine glycosylase
MEDRLDASLLNGLRRVPREFYRVRALDLAPRLLGLILVHETPDGVTAGRLTEVEAYEGPEDRASHAFGGRRTARTDVMFGPPGHTYVYFTYGMHSLFNVVAAPEEVPHVVLVRSIEPLTGLALMAKRRGGALPLAEGPARLAQAMDITGHDNAKDLVSSDLYIAFPPQGLDEPVDYAVTCRIGVEGSGEARDYPWRFVEKGSAPARPRSRARAY